MKKLFVVLFIIAVTGGYVFGNTTNSAVLEVSVSVQGLLSVTVNEDIVLGELIDAGANTESYTDEGEVEFFAIVAYSVTMTSSNEGAGDWDFALKLADKDKYISYNLSFNDTTKIGSRGKHTTGFDIDNLNYEGSEGLAPAGAYSDEVTINVTSD